MESAHSMRFDRPKSSNLPPPVPSRPQRPVETTSVKKIEATNSTTLKRSFSNGETSGVQKVRPPLPARTSASVRREDVLMVEDKNGVFAKDELTPPLLPILNLAEAPPEEPNDKAVLSSESVLQSLLANSSEMVEFARVEHARSRASTVSSTISSHLLSVRLTRKLHEHEMGAIWSTQTPLLTREAPVRSSVSSVSSTISSHLLSIRLSGKLHLHLNESKDDDSGTSDSDLGADSDDECGAFTLEDAKPVLPPRRAQLKIRRQGSIHVTDLDPNDAETAMFSPRLLKTKTPLPPRPKRTESTEPPVFDERQPPHDFLFNRLGYNPESVIQIARKPEDAFLHENATASDTPGSPFVKKIRKRASSLMQMKLRSPTGMMPKLLNSPTSASSTIAASHAASKMEGYRLRYALAVAISSVLHKRLRTRRASIANLESETALGKRSRFGSFRMGIDRLRSLTPLKQSSSGKVSASRRVSARLEKLREETLSSIDDDGKLLRRLSFKTVPVSPVWSKRMSAKLQQRGSGRISLVSNEVAKPMSEGEIAEDVPPVFKQVKWENLSHCDEWL